MVLSDGPVSVGGTTLGVRAAGPVDGPPVLHFHGTPGSRLELAWADDVIRRAGVRLVAFDRPGYGQSTPQPFSLSTVARLALDLADHLGWARFATTGWSGGGPFALATAAHARDRVSAVGVIAGAGPFQMVPGALDMLSEDDTAAVNMLPADPVGAARAFAAGFGALRGLTDATALSEAVLPLLSARDRELLSDPVRAEALLAAIQEALRPGTLGGGWDNVAWVGDWDIALDAVECPVLLWYGSEDRMAPPAMGIWLAQHLSRADLTMRPGEGHLAAFEHLEDMLGQLQTVMATG